VTEITIAILIYYYLLVSIYADAGTPKSCAAEPLFRVWTWQCGKTRFCSK